MIQALKLIALVSQFISVRGDIDQIPADSVEDVEPLSLHIGDGDIYAYAVPGYGMYQVPMRISIGNKPGTVPDLNHTIVDYTYNYKSGLDWFEYQDMTGLNVYGRFMDWDGAWVEIDAMMEGEPNITIAGPIPRKVGCWTDWEKWTAPAFVDQYGVEWPRTYLTFDWPNMKLQSILYRVPELGCSTRTYVIDYDITCEGFSGPLGTVRDWYPFPSQNTCVPANQHTVTAIDWKGANGVMNLTLGDVVQTFYGTPINPATARRRSRERRIGTEEWDIDQIGEE